MTNTTTSLLLRGLVLASIGVAVNGFVSVQRVGAKFGLKTALDDDYPISEKILLEEKVSFDRFISRMEPMMSSVEEAQYANGMPWQNSIKAQKDNFPPLTYMPFWEWQMNFMKSNLSNLHVLPCTSRDSPNFRDSTLDLSFNENEKKGARIVNLCFGSDEYRKIRMTYYDAGEGCQVFNSLWYPQEGSNLPLLGVDLLAFNGKKFLAIVDFQPLHEDEEDHAKMYEEQIMTPIRDRYPSLQGQMSSKFYDETQFFSRQMLFTRFEDEGLIMNDLFPAFKEYVAAHVALVQDTKLDASNIELVRERISKYDTYSAERDPATGLFAGMFGQQWADEYVHGFLFSQSIIKDQGEQTSGQEKRPQREHGASAPAPVLSRSR